MKTLRYVNLKACSLTEPHPVWILGPSNPLTTVKASTKAKLLTQRYPLYYSRTAGSNYGQPCPLCQSSEETLAHFLLDCEKLESVRSLHMQKLSEHLDMAKIDQPQNDEKWVQIILDPSWCCKSRHLNLVLEKTTRDFVFHLHHARSKELGYPTRYGMRDMKSLLAPNHNRNKL